MNCPFTGKEMKAMQEWREMRYRNEVFKVLFHFYRCEDIGEQFEDEWFSNLNYSQIVDQYQNDHTRQFPD